jgi:hypothetical protein
MELNMINKEKKDKDIEKAFNKLRKDGLIVDVVGQDGVVTMLTAKGYEQYNLLNLFSQVNQTNPIDPKDKPKKSGQEKMDSAIKTIVQVGAGISELMQGLGKLAGDPVKMDMSQAGIDVGQNRKSKQKRKYNKGKKRKNKR